MAFKLPMVSELACKIPENLLISSGKPVQTVAHHISKHVQNA